MEHVESPPRRTISPLAVEATVFLAPSVVMAPLLVRAGAVEWQGALLHVVTVLVIWVAFVSVRTSIRGHAFSVVRPVVVFAQAVVWLTVLALQAAALFTIDAWGSLLTLPMAFAYLRQGASLLDVAAIPAWGVAAAASVLLALLVMAFRAFGNRVLDTWDVSSVAPWLRDLGLAVLSVGIMHGFLASTASLDHTWREPIGLFLNPHEQHAFLQNWAIAPSPHEEERQEEARATYRPAAGQSFPNIIIIVMDALRADRLGIHGYERSLTPAIDRWSSAPGVVVVPMFRSVCAETSCGVLALARSKHPWEITPADFSLYEVLDKNGFRNFFYLSGDFTNFYGLREAFRPSDIYIDSTKITGRLNDDSAIVRAFESAPRFDGTPTLIQFQLMSAHGLGDRNGKIASLQPQLSPYGVHLRRRLPSDVETQQIINYYDNGVAQLDVEFARLESLLRGKGYLDNAIVVLTGDHGELLGEGGYVTHARSTEEPVLSPPLIIRRYGPGSEQPLAGSAPALASQVDVAPTILRAAGVPIPSGWSGRPLQDALTGRVAFFAQGHEWGLYANSGIGVEKVVFDRRNHTLDVELWRTPQSWPNNAPIAVLPSPVQRQRWIDMLKTEIGPGWVGEDEGK